MRETLMIVLDIVLRSSDLARMIAKWRHFPGYASANDPRSKTAPRVLHAYQSIPNLFDMLLQNATTALMTRDCISHSYWLVYRFTSTGPSRRVQCFLSFRYNPRSKEMLISCFPARQNKDLSTLVSKILNIFRKQCKWVDVSSIHWENNLRSEIR
jgi:hypothetical protein